MVLAAAGVNHKNERVGALQFISYTHAGHPHRCLDAASLPLSGSGELLQVTAQNRVIYATTASDELRLEVLSSLRQLARRLLKE